MKFSFSWVVPCAVVSALLGLTLPAQENREVSSVILSVKDQSGAVIPNAEVRIVPPPSGAEHRLKTDIDGNLSFELLSGSYDLTVASRGFRSVIKHVDAKPSSRQEIEVILQIGPERFCPVCQDSEPLMKPSLPPIESRLYETDDKAQAQHTGTVCVAARIDEPFWKEPATLPNGEINSHGLKLRLDTRPVNEWPERKSLKIEGLDADERHLLAVLDSSGKPIQSVRFKFSDYKSTDLCLLYNGYQGIALKGATRKTPWCKCR